MASNPSNPSSSHSEHNSQPIPSPKSQSQRQPRLKTKAQRPKRSTTVPSKIREGIDRRIPGMPSTAENQPSPKKSKGVRFTDSSEASKRKPIDPKEATQKGKEKASEPEMPKKKRARTKRASSPTQAQSKSQRSTPSKRQRTQSQSQGEHSKSVSNSDDHETSPIRMTNAITETQNFHQPPENFDTQTASVATQPLTKFKELYSPKELCPVVTVNLAKLKDDLNCNVYPWLGQFESFLSISAPYSPTLVKLFYFNMEWDNLVDEDGNVVEQRVSTKVRNTTITISASVINEILQISNPPPPPEINYSNTRIFEILRPNEPVPNDQIAHLSFSPVSMPPLHRVVWYIYSRNLLQKGGSYTHFAKKDYPLFAAIIDKTPINLGEWLFQEMTKFRFSSRGVAYVPFGSLVSVILFYHRIWHLLSAPEMKRPSVFGKTQINQMRISFEQASGQSKASARSYARASQARGDEATSTQAPSTSRASGLLEEKIRKMIAEAMDDLMGRIESEVGTLVSEITRSYNEVSATQADISATLGTLVVNQARLEEKFDKLLQSQSSKPGPSTEVGTSSDSHPPSPPRTTPLSPTPITTVHTSATTQTIPSTDMIIHPSFIPTSTSPKQTSPTTSTETTIIVEDDKGGEE